MTRRSRLSDSEITDRMTSLPDWEVLGQVLSREFKFHDFAEAFSFMTAVAFVAERMNHHPDWHNVYSEVTIDLTTDDAGGITENDFAMAAEISRIFQRFRSSTLDE